MFSGKIKLFVNDVNQFSEIKQVYHVTGSQNIHIRAVLKDQLHLQQFIDTLINYGDTMTHLILSEIKKDKTL